ncbi:MAG: sigma-70 family RNA polymerase sigma factor [Bacteroidetes bacterium]|nr:MAG: sigma-70 family RNA polymerase sigma factor [Bacteroidota bacterium]TAG92785.1 MAG: sigma-70 family RNA polymerase sigma factor [Bacteroidota bacterium]
MISDQKLINQLKNGDNASFEILYKLFFPAVSYYITNHNGNTEDAKDIFQESVIILLKKLEKEDFKLTSSLKTFLFAIAKNLWLKYLRDNKLVTMENLQNLEKESEIFSIEIYPEKTNEEKLNTWLSKITIHCQNILKAIFFQNETLSSLMKKLGWKNKHTASNQQYKCIQQIKKEQKKEEKK